MYEVNVPAGEITWKQFHDITEKKLELASKLENRAQTQCCRVAFRQYEVKRSLCSSLAIFDSCSSAAIKTFFIEKEDSASFLGLIHTWWMISNSKMKENLSHRLGDAAKRRDNKPILLREFADWIEEWDNNLRTSKSDTLTLSSQTSEALKRTLRATACLIEDILSEDYEFVLTSRFQSDPIER